MDFSVLSICAGAGGLDLGLKLAVPGARTVCYVEREITAASILGARMRDGSLDVAPIWTDLRTFDGRPLRHRARCVVAGYILASRSGVEEYSRPSPRAGQYGTRRSGEKRPGRPETCLATEKEYEIR